MMLNAPTVRHSSERTRINGVYPQSLASSTATADFYYLIQVRRKNRRIGQFDYFGKSPEDPAKFCSLLVRFAE